MTAEQPGLPDPPPPPAGYISSALRGEPVGPPGWVSSSEHPARCPHCAADVFDAVGLCQGCGQRRPTGVDRGAYDLGSVAAVTDIGHRHHRNEDAVAIGTLPGVALTVLCDGVSSSSRGDAASHAAVDAAMPALRDALAAGAPAGRALEAAVAAARRAVLDVSGPAGGNPPSSTFVAAVVTDSTITIGWVGDSRAYWLPDAGAPAQLTVDDSLTNELIAAGMSPEEAHANPQGGALVRWLGVDADDGPPKLTSFRPETPGRVVVCSDGLSRYRPAPDALAADTPAVSPVDAARHLTALALDAGGVDNITVTVTPFGSG